MGLVMLVLAAVGAALVKNASDDPMSVFGYSMLIFSLGYAAGLLRQHFDAVDSAPALPASRAESPSAPYAQAAE